MLYVTSCTVSILSIFFIAKFTLIEELYPLQEFLRSFKTIKMHALLKYVYSETASHNTLLLKGTQLSNILQLKSCLLKEKILLRGHQFEAKEWEKMSLEIQVTLSF